MDGIHDLGGMHGFGPVPIVEGSTYLNSTGSGAPSLLRKL